MSYELHLGDALTVLRTMPAESVQCCVTSPPYFGLRDYGHAGQIGLEETPAAYVAALVEVFGEVWRVLRNDGTLWLNLGDSYAGAGPSGASYQSETTKRRADMKSDGAFRISKSLAARGLSYAEKKPIPPAGLKAKDLMGIPWRVAFALQGFGWYLRSDIIWHKPNPMPESVTDRPTKSHEYLFLLTKQERYYYDSEAVAEPSQGRQDEDRAKFDGGGHSSIQLSGRGGFGGMTRNRRSVWTVSTQPYKGAHFATFPKKLIEPCILAGSKVGDTVLDPFNGSGTTGAVALEHGRNYAGIELNPAYIELAHERIRNTQPCLQEAQ